MEEIEMINYIDEVNKKVNIEEGRKLIENILITIYFKEGISTKELARDNLLPIPIVAAIKREFIKKNLIVQDRGTRLTKDGRYFIEEYLGFKEINKELYMKLFTEPWEDHREIIKIKEELEEIFNNRPQVDVSIDQSKADVDTSLKRAILSIENHNLVGKNILCLGDDDLVSIALGFLVKKLFKNTDYYSTKITVMDIDSRIINYINNIAIEEGLPIECEEVDLREPLDNIFKNKFDCFFTDPPYTRTGMKLFISRGIAALKDDIGLTIYFSYGHKSPTFQLDMQKDFLDMGLIVVERMAQFNSYEGASIIGSTGQMIILRTTNKTKALLEDSYIGALYTGEFRKTVRKYRCKRCGITIRVGNSEKIKNIEMLKTEACHKCGSYVFDLIERKEI